MPSDDTTLAEAQRRFLGANVNKLSQDANGGGTLTGDNGDPNDAGDPSSVGVDLTALNSPYVLFGLECATQPITARLWYLIKGETDWARLHGVELTVEQAVKEIDELKARGIDRVYAQRTDGLGGAWSFEVWELH